MNLKLKTKLILLLGGISMIVTIAALAIVAFYLHVLVEGINELNLSADVAMHLNVLRKHFCMAILLLAVIAAIGTFIPLMILAKRIADPIASATRFADMLSKGENPQQMPPDKSGVQETTHLIIALNRMRDRLNAVIEKLKRTHSREQKARMDVENQHQIQSGFTDAAARKIHETIDAGNGFIALMKKSIQNGEPVRLDLVEAAEEQFGKLRLWENLLKDIVMTYPDFHLEMDRIETWSFIQQEIDNVMPLCRETGAQVELQYASDTPQKLTFDREKLHDMLSRILRAVVKNIPSGRHITFSANTDAAGHFIFRITGSGANRAVQDYLLYQSAGNQVITQLRATAEVIQFFIVQQRVRMMGGEFLVQCIDGQPFVISFLFDRDLIVTQEKSVIRNTFRAENHSSLDDTTILLRPITRSHLHSSSDGRRIRTLSIPRDETNRLLLNMMLRDIPECDLTVRPDLKAATKYLLNEKKVDAVVLDPDCHAGDESLLSIVQNLKKNMDQTGKTCRLIVLITSAETNELEQLKAAGATTCLLKPVVLDSLAAAIRGEEQA